MSFGAGIAAGMGAGMGSGIAIGMASGRKRAAEEIRAHIERNELSIIDRQGKPIKLDVFLEDAISDSSCASSSNQTAWVVLGILLAVLALGLLVALLIYVRATA